MKGHVVLAAAVVLGCAVVGVWASPAKATPTPRLLATYQPVTYFHPAESFLPTKVQSFVSDSTLEQFSGGAWTLVDADPDPGDLPQTGGIGWRLNQQPCSPSDVLGGLACYAASGDQGSGGLAVYGRVAHDDGRIVLQYWYFYYDDVYSYPFAPEGALWQAHEGDWEVVNVVLADDETPLFVGYSQHCLGQRRAWTDVKRFDGTHPIVYVALGSHANYFEPGLHEFNSTCVPRQVHDLLQSLHLPQPADVASGDGVSSGPNSAAGPVTTIHQIDDGQPSWVGFPGTWGELQYLHAPAPNGTVAFGLSPQGPAFHDVWAHPLATLAGWPVG